jgi:Domain of unknown function (DUF4112)
MAMISISTAKPIDRVKTINRLRNIARVMDTAVKIPGTKIRFGADSIIGLVPGAGDLVTMGISIYVLAEAARLGLPREVLLKMAGNIAIDTGIGAIPIVGDIFDMFFKSNTKNLSLLLEAIGRNNSN